MGQGTGNHGLPGKPDYYNQEGKYSFIKNSLYRFCFIYVEGKLE